MLGIYFLLKCIFKDFFFLVPEVYLGILAYFVWINESFHLMKTDQTFYWKKQQASKIPWNVNKNFLVGPRKAVLSSIVLYCFFRMSAYSKFGQLQDFLFNSSPFTLWQNTCPGPNCKRNDLIKKDLIFSNLPICKRY